MGVTCCNIKSIVKNARFYHKIRWNLEIAIGDAADGGHGLRVRKISAIKGQA